MATSCKGIRFFVKCLLLFPLLVLAAGCGKQGTVSGKVTYKGEALTTGIVAFYPDGQGGSFTSPIKPDGTYSIPKVPPGTAKISVAVGSSEAPTLGKGVGGVGGPGGGAKKAGEGMKKQQERLKENLPPEIAAARAAAANAVRIPENYSDPDASGLKVEVTGGQQTHNIDLK